MNAPGKGMLKVTSILFIIFGAIATVIVLAGMALAGAATAMLGELNSEVAAAVGGIAIVALIVSLLMFVGELVIGILGVKKSADPSQANFFIVTGIVFCAIGVVSIILSGFQWTSLIGFVLPILYIIGGFQNKNAANAPAAQA